MNKSKVVTALFVLALALGFYFVIQQPGVQNSLSTTLEPMKDTLQGWYASIECGVDEEKCEDFAPSGAEDGSEGVNNLLSDEGGKS